MWFLHSRLAQIGKPTISLHRRSQRGSPPRLRTAPGEPELTKAFREHFQVPRNARSIGDRITQRQHSDFIALFLAEAQGQVQAAAPAEPGP